MCVWVCVCVCVCEESLYQRAKYIDCELVKQSEAGGWSASQKSPSNEDTSVIAAQTYLQDGASGGELLQLLAINAVVSLHVTCRCQAAQSVQDYIGKCRKSQYRDKADFTVIQPKLLTFLTFERREEVPKTGPLTRPVLAQRQTKKPALPQVSVAIEALYIMRRPLFVHRFLASINRCFTFPVTSSGLTLQRLLVRCHPTI